MQRSQLAVHCQHVLLWLFLLCHSHDRLGSDRSSSRRSNASWMNGARFERSSLPLLQAVANLRDVFSFTTLSVGRREDRNSVGDVTCSRIRAQGEWNLHVYRVVWSTKLLRLHLDVPKLCSDISTSGDNRSLRGCDSLRIL